MIRNAWFGARFLGLVGLLIGLLTVGMQPACVVCTTGQCNGPDQAAR